MIRILVLVSIIIATGEIIFLSLDGTSPRQGYAPDQPVAFSHKLHSGEMDIPCQYCHTQVAKGRHASVDGAGGWQEDEYHPSIIVGRFRRGGGGAREVLPGDLK